MRFDTLNQIEARFRAEAALSLTPFSLPVPNENLTLQGFVYKPLNVDYFFPVEHPKQRIVLHFTAGNIRSDVQSLTQQSRHVSVPFVIARDGTIYQLFPSKFWSGHLGEGVGNKKGTGNPQDKATIGIELSNYGYLVPQGAILETIYSRVKDPLTGKIGPIDQYCALENHQAFTKIASPFREQNHYSSFTIDQLDSLIILLRFLTTKYNIPREFLAKDKQFSTTNDVLNFKGIVSHINYRESGKWDIGPAFDWNTIMQGVQAPRYDSKLPIARTFENVLTSEEEIEALFPQSRSVFMEEETTDNEGYNPNDFDELSLSENNMKTSKKVYALLVGINNYDKVRKLSGCLNDVNAVEKYLKFNTDLNTDIKKLTDKQATRKGVADGFRNFLSKAQRDDTVLFYYSGHGTQEEADTTLWNEETDGALECIVCYDGGTTKPADFLLTDKELRFLIHELSEKTKAHIVTIFDSCNSGDNTRNGGLMEASLHEVNIRRVFDKSGRFFPKRNWNEFLFSDTFQEPISHLPEGVHIQMAACESDQSALEVSGEGVFTKTLLKTLKDCGGNISYNTLRSRIRQYMRANYEQTPRIYMPINAAELLDKGFLNRPINSQKILCEATWNSKQGWQLNVGAIHGVNVNSKIILIDPDNFNKTTHATIRENGVFIDYSLLDVSGSDTSKIYKAEVADLLTQELKIELQNHDATPDEASKLINALSIDSSGVFSLGGEKKANENEKDSGKAETADYTLHARSGEVYLTMPNDPYRPLIRPIVYVGKNDFNEITETLQHISRWHFIKNLENNNKPNNFPNEPLKIDIIQLLADGSKKVITISNATANLEYEKIDNDWRGTIQLKITNTTNQNLYFCAAYLSKEFQCFLDFLPQRVQLLEAGKFIFLGLTIDEIKQESINLKLGKVEQEYNWSQTLETLKFIISTTVFDGEALALEELPLPLTSSDRSSAKGLVTMTEQERGFEIGKGIQFSGWVTQTLNLVFKNPVYNIIPANTLKTLLEWEETAYFASGLYCDITLDKFGQPTIWKPKKGIKVPEDEKGLFGDIKLWLGNQIETAQRRKRYRILKEDPNRLRIVAEGDSWFQYPILLQDTIDQLYKRYAIRSFAEAGDTLQNYLKIKEYLAPIAEENADFFLVSGGGNDVLGEGFQYFLRDTPDSNDTTPKRYLNQKFFDQLVNLEYLYEQMFAELLSRYNNLHILVHCYDYIIPVDTSNPKNKKTQSWSGKYMIQKGIAPQIERELLIRYILDQFAEKIKALTMKDRFQNKVSFIDTRGLVVRNNWFDEIHPKDEGFALVANKFIEEIEKIRDKKKTIVI